MTIKKQKLHEILDSLPSNLMMRWEADYSEKTVAEWKELFHNDGDYYLSTKECGENRFSITRVPVFQNGVLIENHGRVLREVIREVIRND